MKYSVIVPVYNAEKFIQRCINSVLSDSRDDLEIIVVNDGSLDNSLEIIEKIASTDLRVKVHSQKNRGVSSARNYGIEKAEGEYIEEYKNVKCYVKDGLNKNEYVVYVYYVSAGAVQADAQAAGKN